VNRNGDNKNFIINREHDASPMFIIGARVCTLNEKQYAEIGRSEFHERGKLVQMQIAEVVRLQQQQHLSAHVT